VQRRRHLRDPPGRGAAPIAANPPKVTQGRVAAVAPLTPVDNPTHRPRPSPSLEGVEWEHLFDDLEGQLAAEWESERAALDAESERLRISKLTLHDRLRTMSASEARVVVELAGGECWDAALRVIGADWVGLSAGGDPRLRIAPLHAIESLGVDHGTLLASLSSEAAEPGLRARMTIGFVLRDLARRRVPVTIGRRSGDPQHGTIDRAGADHLDLAVHDASEPRRMRSVRGFRSIPFSALSWVRLEDASGVL